jgi:hypothetical protein
MNPLVSPGNNMGVLMKEGSRSLLVLVDTRAEKAYKDAESGVLAALDHWGMPYQRHDLAEGQPEQAGLRGCPGVILAQQGASMALTDESAKDIAEAVAGGMGYLGCDGYVGYAPPALQQMAGVRVQDVQPAFGVCVVDSGAWVSRWQVQGTRYRLRRSVELTCVALAAPRVRVLLESDGYPGMWITRYGAGRVVQWAVSAGIWQREVFGHCEGLDDLLWRGIVWMVSKPFAMLAMPPFSTSCVSDAIGTHDFDWIEALWRHGFPPHVSMFPDDIDALSEIRGQSGFGDRAVTGLRSYAAQGKAEFSPQAATWNRAYLLYCRADGSEIPAEELSLRLAAVDKQYARYGVPWARTVNPHYHQLGYNALPHLAERGVEFTMAGQLPGEAWEGEHELWDCSPFGHPGYAIAPLQGADEFYVVTSGESYLHTTEQTGLSSYRIRPSLYAEQNDIMWGRTRWHEQCRVNDWPAIVDAAERQIRLGLNALFFACPATREQTVAAAPLTDWEMLWSEVDRRVASYERWPALYSDVAVYARARHQTRLIDAHFDGTVLLCHLEGKADTALYLYVWMDQGNGESVRHRYEEVAPFSGTERVSAVLSQV